MANYGTEDDFDTYCDDRGYTVPDGDVAQALIRASMWLDGRFGARFPGRRTEGRDQALAWPRTDAYDIERELIDDAEVPTEIEHATYEAALRELASAGSLSPDYVQGTQVKSERVGPIAVEYSGSYSAADMRPCVTVVEDILRPIIGSSGPFLFGRTGRA